MPPTDWAPCNDNVADYTKSPRFDRLITSFFIDAAQVLDGREVHRAPSHYANTA